MAQDEMLQLSNTAIAQAFVQTPTTDPTNLSMLTQLGPFKSAEVDRQAMRLLEAWIQDPQINRIRGVEALHLVAQRLGVEVDKAEMHRTDASTQVRWQEIRQSLGIGEIASDDLVDQIHADNAWKKKLYADASSTYGVP